VRRLVLLLLATALAVSGCTGSKPPKPPAVNGLKVFTENPNPRHTTKHVTYDHTPPAGGQHFPAWLRCDVYTDPVPNEFAVHSEEHGAVWLTYLPGEDPSKLVALRSINRDYVLVSPYPGQPGKYMASTWGAQLSVDSPDDPGLATFVKTYAGGGQGGEKGADCAHGFTPDQARAAFAKANP
jgi:hypothetical protein